MSKGAASYGALLLFLLIPSIPIPIG